MAVRAQPIARAPVLPGLLGPARVLRELPLLPTVVLGLLVFTALFAGVLAPYDPTIPVPGSRVFAPPFWMDGGSLNAPLGTDFQGRDLLSRLIYGARVSLIVALAGTAVAGLVGMFMGIMAGYFGGWVDMLIM